jgi:hypothetical protein
MRETVDAAQTLFESIRRKRQIDKNKDVSCLKVQPFLARGVTNENVTPVVVVEEPSDSRVVIFG